MKRLVAAGLMAAALVISPAVAAQQPQPPAAQDEYVPVSQLPAAEQLPAAPLVIGSYAFIWVAVFVYLWSIWRKLGTVDRELAELRRNIGARR